MNQRSGTILTNTQLFPSQNITTRNIYALGICTRQGLPDPPPYLGLSPKKTIFWDLPLNLKQSFQLRKIDALRSMHPAHFARRDQSGVILSEGAARQNRSYGNQNLTHKVSCNLPLVSRKVVALCL